MTALIPSSIGMLGYRELTSAVRITLLLVRIGGLEYIS